MCTLTITKKRIQNIKNQGCTHMAPHFLQFRRSKEWLIFLNKTNTTGCNSHQACHPQERVQPEKLTGSPGENPLRPVHRSTPLEPRYLPRTIPAKTAAICSSTSRKKKLWNSQDWSRIWRLVYDFGCKCLGQLLAKKTRNARKMKDYCKS